MRYHLFQKFFGKMVKKREMSFLSTREDTNFLPPLYGDSQNLVGQAIVDFTKSGKATAPPAQ